jgi:hypothetical protein
VISWKAFWTALTVVFTATCAGVAYFAGVGPWVAVGAQAAAGLVAGLIAALVVHEAEMFAAVPTRSRSAIIRLVWVGAVVHLVWAVTVAARPDLWPSALLALVALAGTQYWLARGHEYLLTRPRRVVPTTVVNPGAGPAAGTEHDDHDDHTKILVAALDRAGYAHLTVIRWEPVGDPPFGMRVWVRMPSRQTSRDAKNSRVGLTGADAEPIAIGLAEVLRQPVMSDWVAVHKERAAGTYTLLIVTEDVMARVHPWRDNPTWSTITSPKCIGYGMDSQPVMLRLDQHGQLSGQTRSGKTSLVHIEWAHVTLCTDAIIWVAGVEKLYDLVGGWVEPYTGHDLPLPVDWVASGQTDLLGMLVAAMTVARWRQRQPMTQRQGFVTIILYLDEASFALRNNKAKATYQGVAYTAAQLVGMLTQGAGSAGVYIRFISQRGVNSHFGDQGGDTTANAGFVAAFSTRDAADIGRLTGDYQLPSPRHKGECWLDSGDGPTRVKVSYLQEVDPSKPVLHDGPTVSTVAWDRRHFVRGIDEGSGRAAGDSYAHRHTRMDGDMLAYLTDTEPIEPTDELEQTGIAGLTSDAARNAAAEALAELDRAGLGTPRTTTTPAGPMGVVTMTGRRSRADRIAEIVEHAGIALSVSDITAALRSTGDHADPQVITNALTKLVADGRLHRPERGLYRHG